MALTKTGKLSLCPVLFSPPAHLSLSRSACINAERTCRIRRPFSKAAAPAARVYKEDANHTPVYSPYKQASAEDVKFHKMAQQNPGKAAFNEGDVFEHAQKGHRIMLEYCDAPVGPGKELLRRPREPGRDVDPDETAAKAPRDHFNFKNLDGSDAGVASGPSKMEEMLNITPDPGEKPWNRWVLLRPKPRSAQTDPDGNGEVEYERMGILNTVRALWNASLPDKPPSRRRRKAQATREPSPEEQDEPEQDKAEQDEQGPSDGNGNGNGDQTQTQTQTQTQNQSAQGQDVARQQAAQHESGPASDDTQHVGHQQQHQAEQGASMPTPRPASPDAQEQQQQDQQQQHNPDEYEYYVYDYGVWEFDENDASDDDDDYMDEDEDMDVDVDMDMKEDEDEDGDEAKDEDKDE